MKRLAIATLLLVLCGGAGAHAQALIFVDTTIQIPNVLDIGGSGARARGMGGAYIAAGDDASALTWNPAGLYSIDKTMMTLGYDRFSAGGKVTFGPLSVPQTGSFGGPGFFSLVSPFRIKGHGFVGGLSYGRTSDEAANIAQDFAFLIDPDGPAPQYDTTVYNIALRRTYHASFTPVTAGFGTRLSEKLAAGFTIRIINGKSVDRLDQHNQAADFLVPEYYPQRVQYDLAAAIIDSSKFSGVSFSFGFKYNQPKLLLGAVLKPPYTLRQTTNRTLRAVTTVNGLVRQNGTGVIFRDGNVIEIDMPLMLGVGGAYKPNEATTFSADFEYRPFSGKDIKIRDSLKLVPGAKDEEFFRTVDPEWRNVLILRAGAERILTTSSAIFPVIPVRTGIGFMPVPLANTTNGKPSGSATSLNLSLGTGVQWSQFHVDVAYTFRSLKQTFKDDEFGTTEVNGKSHLMYLTFTGYF